MRKCGFPIYLTLLFFLAAYAASGHALKKRTYLGILSQRNKAESKNASNRGKRAPEDAQENPFGQMPEGGQAFSTPQQPVTGDYTTVNLPKPVPEIKNPSGVNLGSLSKIQGDMASRVSVLEDKVEELSDGVDTLDKNAPEVTYEGTDIHSEVVDPVVIQKQLQEYEAAKAKQRAAEQSARKEKELLVGRLSPPIIILEAANEDPLEKLLMMRLATCRDEEESPAGSQGMGVNDEEAMREEKNEEENAEEFEEEEE